MPLLLFTFNNEEDGFEGFLTGDGSVIGEVVLMVFELTSNIIGLLLVTGVDMDDDIEEAELRFLFRSKSDDNDAIFVLLVLLP